MPKFSPFKENLWSLYQHMLKVEIEDTAILCDLLTKHRDDPDYQEVIKETLEKINSDRESAGRMKTTRIIYDAYLSSYAQTFKTIKQTLVKELPKPPLKEKIVESAKYINQNKKQIVKNTFIVLGIFLLAMTFFGLIFLKMRDVKSDLMRIAPPPKPTPEKNTQARMIRKFNLDNEENQCQTEKTSTDTCADDTCVANQPTPQATCSAVAPPTFEELLSSSVTFPLDSNNFDAINKLQNVILKITDNPEVKNLVEQLIQKTNLHFIIGLDCAYMTPAAKYGKECNNIVIRQAHLDSPNLARHLRIELNKAQIANLKPEVDSFYKLNEHPIRARTDECASKIAHKITEMDFRLRTPHPLSNEQQEIAKIIDKTAAGATLEERSTNFKIFSREHHWSRHDVKAYDAEIRDSDMTKLLCPEITESHQTLVKAYSA